MTNPAWSTWPPHGRGSALAILAATALSLSRATPAGAGEPPPEPIVVTRIQCGALVSGMTDAAGAVLTLAQPACGTGSAPGVIAHVGFIGSLGYDGPPPRPASLPILGDLSGDGRVNGADLALLLGAWGACIISPTACDADLNHDHVVNGLDIAIILGNWTG